MRAILSVLLILVSLLAACARAAPSPAAPSPAPTSPLATGAGTPAPTETPIPPTLAPAPTDTPAPSATPPPTDTPAPTDTPMATSTPSPSDTPAPTSAPTLSPNALVKLATLNVRAGPGTAYAVITRVAQGEELVVLGQAQNCAWLKIRTPQNKEGWVAGSAQYVTFGRACADVPQAEVPPTPVPPTRPPVPTSAPAPAATAAAEPKLPADQGCYLLENFLGVELNFTIGSGGWNDSFKIPAMGQHVMCLNPGHYNYTIDAPPPWGSTNGSLDAVAGQHRRFPIQGRQ